MTPNPYYCAADVHDSFGAGFSQCGNKRKQGSEFCGTHSPEAKARREVKSKTYWESESERWNAPARERERLLRALQRILNESHNPNIERIAHDAIEDSR